MAYSSLTGVLLASLDFFPEIGCSPQPAGYHCCAVPLILLRHEIFCLVGGNLRAQQGHRGRARASATISR